MYREKNKLAPKSKNNNENYENSNYEIEEEVFQKFIKNLRKKRPSKIITLDEIEIKIKREFMQVSNENEKTGIKRSN